MSDFMLPDIGEGIVECELVKWLVSEGDEIEEDQPVAEVMTDKALVEIPAPYKGRITRLYYREGEIARVHEPLFALVADNAEDEVGAKAHAGGDDETRSREPAATPAAAAASATTDATSRAEVAASSADEASEDFILPDIGEGIVECEVVEWRVAEGDEIEEDQPVVDVMTDKALVEITAPKAGRVTQRYYQQGENARVHSPLFAFIPREQEAKPASSGPSTPQPRASEPAVAPVAKASGEEFQRRVPATPAVRRLAREHGLRLADIRGSGKNGRVLKADVLAHVEGASAAAQPKAAPQPAPAPAREGAGEVRVEPIKGMQAVMAKRMAQAASTIPHFTYGDEIDVTDLLALRERLKPEAEARGTRVTLMPFIMKAMALAVAEYPILNSRVNDAVTEIHYQPHCNIGMAVDSRVGLIVPNIKQVERRTLLDIAAEVARLTTAARDGRVGQADLKDGTISISNIGALGGTYTSPIINAPEVAIVALGKTQRLPRFDAQGQVVERAIMTVSWAGDHRIIDGGTIARFCNRWKGLLESPQSMLLHLG
ncbi:dihydrolipoyllysine-residue acetyltransferase [Aquisalimonas sp.]|uniref:dihydrolipoyllysine-residue acetyltransferase n=1 Tax=Aquisalimonas sp. TaxID=1872621 RepID=UPI0025BD5218|nr:dihydrolipoyllysine-residue acetyltransferase [Aquisalimonas sp.]